MLRRRILDRRSLLAIAAFTTSASSLSFNAAAAGGGGDGASAVRLATSVARPFRPTTVLVHGLDSSKQTWETCLAELQRDGYPALAVDLRGVLPRRSSPS